MKNIMTETEYNEMVKNGRRGEYPRVLTTDGYKFGVVDCLSISEITRTT